MSAEPPRNRAFLALHPLLAALVFTTRLPWPRLDWSHNLMQRSMGWLPQAGVVIGVLLALLWLVASMLWSPLVVAVVVVIAGIVLTGCLHEDGLADSADALGAFHDRERALDIMRDHQIGTYGALALVSLIALRIAVFSELVHFAVMLPLLVSVHAFSRMACLFPLELPSARPDGLSAKCAALSIHSIQRAALFMLPVAAVLGPLALCSWLIALLLGLWMHWRCQTWLNGVTGDMAGATVCLAEVAILLLWAWWPADARLILWSTV